MLSNSAAAINDDSLRQTALASNTITQNHHARSVAGFVECEIKGKTAARKGIRENRHPRPPERTACLGANDFNVQLRVIDVSDLEGAVPVARRSPFQLEVEGCMRIGGASALPL